MDEWMDNMDGQTNEKMEEKKNRCTQVRLFSQGRNKVFFPHSIYGSLPDSRLCAKLLDMSSLLISLPSL